MSQKTTGLMAATILMSAVLFGIAPPARGAGNGETISIRFNGPSEIPLEIRNAEAISTSSGLESLRYNLVNRADARLLAVQITWTAHFANDKGPRIEDRSDFAFDFGLKLAPGSSESMEVGLPFEGNSSPIQSVTGEITFAQFADGKTLGSEQNTVLPWLKDRRSAAWNAYGQLIEVYRRGGEAALTEALAAPAESESETALGKAVRKGLLRLRQQNGIAAVEIQLNRLASLQLPE